ncbi:hypothetical protein B1C81_12520 [Streptomyces sp. HG99]|nr:MULTISPECIES: hypothetical protein [Streptomyces]PIB09069.1 hypothetical protein B1C81_12520 [Streptomyces sp. HG99]
MSASESSESASARDVPAQPRTEARVSMRDLLASCAAARAVSTPPLEPAPPVTEPAEVRRPQAA